MNMVFVYSTPSARLYVRHTYVQAGERAI